jgi:hypothetical protein
MLTSPTMGSGCYKKGLWLTDVLQAWGSGARRILVTKGYIKPVSISDLESPISDLPELVTEGTIKLLQSRSCELLHFSEKGNHKRLGLSDRCTDSGRKRYVKDILQYPTFLTYIVDTLLLFLSQSASKPRDNRSWRRT